MHKTLTYNNLLFLKNCMFSLFLGTQNMYFLFKICILKPYLVRIVNFSMSVLQYFKISRIEANIIVVLLNEWIIWTIGHLKNIYKLLPVILILN